MKKNTVKSIVGKNGKLVVRFFDNDSKIRQKSLDLADNKANRKKVLLTMPAFEKALRDKAESASLSPVHFSYYADKYLDQLKATGHTKLIAHTGRTKRMLKYFGTQTDINSITELAIEEFFQSLKCQRQTKVDWLVVLKGIFEKARKGGVLQRKTLEEFKLPKEARALNEGVVEPFTSYEVKILLALSKGSVLHYYLGIAFNLGTRPEETIALQLRDIDLTDRIVHIERAITKRKLKPTKTDHTRSIPLPNSAISYVTHLMTEANRKGTQFLFSKEDGTRLNDIEDIRGKKYRNGPWYKLIEKTGIAHRQLMQTRHTFAVMAIRSNVYPHQAIASILGHTTLRMLIHHYGKYLGYLHLDIPRSVDIFNMQGDVLGDVENNVEIKEVA